MERFLIVRIMQAIRDWSPEERPRERLSAKGPFALSDSELIAIIINTGTRNRSAIDLAKEVLQLADGKIQNLSKLSIENLCNIHGIGKAKAIKLLAVFELGRRHTLSFDQYEKKVCSTKMAAEIAIPLLRDLSHEECWVIYLNQANHIIAKERVSSGGVSGTVIDTRIILKSAVSKLASSIILMHNHPSGYLKPSAQDRDQTTMLRDGAALLGIRLLDHLVIAGNKYYSFAEDGGI